MAPKKFLSCIAALLVCMAIANLQRAEAECGNFQESCNGFNINSNGHFSASCKNEGGKFESSGINLNDFISNDDGTLTAGGDFAATCKNLSWTNEGSVFFINADCAKPDGSYDATSYELSNNLANDNGILSWHVCLRSPVETL